MVNTVARNPGTRWAARVRSTTAFACVAVVAILAFVAWKVIALTSVSERSRDAEIAFAAIETEMAVQQGLEWEAFASRTVSPEIGQAVRRSQAAIDARLAEIRMAGVESPR